MCLFISQHLAIQLRKDKGIYNVISWKSKEVFSSTLYMLQNAILNNIKPFGYEMRIEFDNESLVLEQNNSETKILNA